LTKVWAEAFIVLQAEPPIEPERSRTRIMFASRLDDAATADTVEVLCPKIPMKYAGTVTDALTVTRRVLCCGKSTAAVGPDENVVPCHPVGKFAFTYWVAIVWATPAGLRPAARAAASTAAESLAFVQNKMDPSIARPIIGMTTSTVRNVKRISEAPRSCFFEDDRVLLFGSCRMGATFSSAERASPISRESAHHIGKNALRQ
jgi:hypothetical protein